MRSPKYSVVTYGVVVILTLTMVAAIVVRHDVSIEQPVAFNHKKHTKDLGLACQFCHQYVETGAHPGLPGVETCSMCHQVPQGTSEEAARLTKIITAGDSLQFNKLFRLPSHVFYTHRRHVGIAKLDCTNCHGSIAETERPPKRPLVRIKMKVCLDCHRKENQTVDCVACHR
ncbi:MAG: cytochrome c3 family protein [Gemmatimonadales bacterium]